MLGTKKLGIVEAFKVYGAILKNLRNEVSAIAQDGNLVVSCWNDSFHREGSAMRYEDRLSEWGDHNPVGRKALSGHLTQAQEQALVVRLVIAHRAPVGGARASHFHVRPDLVGSVTHFDNDRFTIDFTKA